MERKTVYFKRDFTLPPNLRSCAGCPMTEKGKEQEHVGCLATKDFMTLLTWEKQGPKRKKAAYEEGLNFSEIPLSATSPILIFSRQEAAPQTVSQ